MDPTVEARGFVTLLQYSTNPSPHFFLPRGVIRSASVSETEGLGAKPGEAATDKPETRNPKKHSGFAQPINKEQTPTRNAVKRDASDRPVRFVPSRFTHHASRIYEHIDES